MKAPVLPAVLLAALLWPLAAKAQSLSAQDAARHVGENATICGVVASAHYAPRSKGQPTFLNLDKPYPSPVFTAVIWGEDRAKFGAPEARLQGKRVCVSGTIQAYRGAPEITLRQPGQISE